MKNIITRTNQCEKCPWRKDVDPWDIPGGYDVEKHKALASTIAEPGVLMPQRGMKLMACHESPPGQEQTCVGWAYNQLGPGNNLGLRMAVLMQDITLQVHGEQHRCLEDTLPKTKRRPGPRKRK